MTEAAAPPSLDRRLLQLGLVLFLVLVLGATWGRLHLSVRARRAGP